MDWTNAYSLTEIGGFIRRVRQSHDITQAEFAQDLGVSRATLSSLENGGGVSAQLMMHALNLLGMRMVIAPKAANVEVREPGR